jgi:hypothetical protein
MLIVLLSVDGEDNFVATVSTLVYAVSFSTTSVPLHSGVAVSVETDAEGTTMKAAGHVSHQTPTFCWLRSIYISMNYTF